MNDNNNYKMLFGGFAAAALFVAIPVIVDRGWSWWLTLAAIALLLNAIINTVLWVAHARLPSPAPPVVHQPPQPVRQDEMQKALSGTDDLLAYLIQDEGHREVFTQDLARFAEENGRPEFAERLREKLPASALS